MKAFTKVIVGFTKDVLMRNKDALMSAKVALMSTKDVLMSTGDILMSAEDVLMSTKDALMSVEVVLMNTKEIPASTHHVKPRTKEPVPRGKDATARGRSGHQRSQSELPGSAPPTGTPPSLRQRHSNPCHPPQLWAVGVPWLTGTKHRPLRAAVGGTSQRTFGATRPRTEWHSPKAAREWHSEIGQPAQNVRLSERVLDGLESLD